MRRSILVSLLFCKSLLIASDPTPPPESPPREELCETTHKITVGGVEISYTAAVGSLLIKDPLSVPVGNLFFTSYRKIESDPSVKRPLTFCFNGGPGSSSIWLHMGFAGPKRVFLPDAVTAPMPPYKIVDNEYSLLDVTDLVFIDPISTGFSRSIPPENVKNFYTTKEDVVSIAKFIRSYLTKFDGWDRPKFLLGESYGTTRASALAYYLHEEELIDLNGIVLVSSVLDYGSLRTASGNDLPYLLFFPSYTAAAWYHKKLPPELSGELEKVLEMSKTFVRSEYLPALFKGNLLSPEEKQKIAQRMASLTGLSKEYILNSDLRIDMQRFAKQLLADENKEIGRFDAEVTGISLDNVNDSLTYDPSADTIEGAFTSSFNAYIRNTLGWKGENDYKVLSDALYFWNFDANNSYLNVSENLRDVMVKNPYLKVFVANGYFDLATPFFATEYTFEHLGPEPFIKAHVTMESYPGGHMMYTDLNNLKKLKEDVALFYQKSLLPPPASKP